MSSPPDLSSLRKSPDRPSRSARLSTSPPSSPRSSIQPFQNGDFYAPILPPQQTGANIGRPHRTIPPYDGAPVQLPFSPSTSAPVPAPMATPPASPVSTQYPAQNPQPPLVGAAVGPTASVSPPIATESTPADSIVVRIITPNSAAVGTNPMTISLFSDGKPVPISTTLRQLKKDIAKRLGVKIELPTAATRTENTQFHCNCDFAKSIAKYGIWDMLRCRSHVMPGDNCDYPHYPFDPTEPCAKCSRQRGDRCFECAETEHDCPLVVNVGCKHVFHQHCYLRHTGTNCPAGCSEGLVARFGRKLSYRYYST